MTGQAGYLLDSHVLIWSLYQRSKLPPRYRPVLEGEAPSWISAATVWEIEIKKKVGRLAIPHAIWSQVVEVGHRFIAIGQAHAIEAARLPVHHGDPFDRMLIAQARSEGLTILTVDRAFAAYDVAIF